MKLAFDDPLFESWLQRPLLNIPDGGAEIGEILAVARRIPEGDRQAWYQAWTDMADSLFDQAEQCQRYGHLVSARQLYLRAFTYYRNSYPLLYGAPVDPRVISGYQRETAAFRCAAALFTPALHSMEIPFEGTTLPAWFYSAGPGPRPLLICVNGYDETLHTMHFAHAVAAQRRGWHVLTFDGPGQGRVLIEQGLHLRSDWETVVAAVIDSIISRPDVDARRVALVGWSFGGLLAARAAAAEPRISALIVDPGMWDLLEAMRAMLSKFGADALAAALPDVTDEMLAPVMDVINSNASLRWTIVQRGFWAHGVETLAQYVNEAPKFNLSKCVSNIQCPVLVTQTEADPTSAFAPVFFEALQGKRNMVSFTSAEGAGGHCQTNARSVYHQRAYDWLSTVFDEIVRFG
ncbi:alpha/beta hydrolase family protein [Allopusillimonas ginsengisoli]|uniref:alpha/beta hydrolase family protein n=1 Tax=Allopusillimonas ginsengisoli TaxID=453575 RepID=UPI0039C29255